MQIKDYKCKCGHNDFFFADKGSQKGIYCSYCGKWVKWADKDEQNLAMKQEPTEWQQDHEILKAYSDGANDMLDKIRAEIYEEFMTIDGGIHDESAKKCMRIIDKYRSESEE